MSFFDWTFFPDDVSAAAMPAAVVSFIFIRRPRAAPAPERVRVEDCFRCEVNAPMPYPADR